MLFTFLLTPNNADTSHCNEYSRCYDFIDISLTFNSVQLMTDFGWLYAGEKKQVWKIAYTVLVCSS